MCTYGPLRQPLAASMAAFSSSSSDGSNEESEEEGGRSPAAMPSAGENRKLSDLAAGRGRGSRERSDGREAPPMQVCRLIVRLRSTAAIGNTPGLCCTLAVSLALAVAWL